MLAAERKVTSKLLEQDTSAEKLYILNEYAYLKAEEARSPAEDEGCVLTSAAT